MIVQPPDCAGNKIFLSISDKHLYKIGMLLTLELRVCAPCFRSMVDGSTQEMREVEVTVEVPAELAGLIEARPGRVQVTGLEIESDRKPPSPEGE